MKTLLKYIWLFIWLSFAASVLPSIASGYDAPTLRANIGYDEQSVSAVNYDYVSVLVGNERKTSRNADCVLLGKFDEFLAAEGTTALSPYRMTTAGETFSHYGYADSAASFEGGLRPGGFATSSGDLSGAEAQSGLALPRPTAPPNAVYTVTPQPGTWIRANPVAEPLFGQPGGLPEFQFPGGTGPGTVFGPMPIPPR